MIDNTEAETSGQWRIDDERPEKISRRVIPVRFLTRRDPNKQLAGR